MIFAAITLIAVLPMNGSQDSTAQAKLVVDTLDMTQVPVPAEPIPVGGQLASFRFTLKEFPADKLPVDAILDLTPHFDKYAVRPLAEGWPLTESVLSAESGAKNALVERIPAGMRAMTIKVDSTTAVEGWAGPDTYVDVVLIEKDRALVIAEKVRVLSAERKVSPINSKESPEVPSTVTLLVTQDQMLAINTAIPRGRITFALRSQLDEQRAKSLSFTFNQEESVPIDKGGRVQFVGRDGVRRTYELLDGEFVPSEIPLESSLAKADRPASTSKEGQKASDIRSAAR